MRLISTFFFFNDTATTEIYTLSLHDALPICGRHPALARLSLRGHPRRRALPLDRKSTRLNSSHSQISYAVFCLKKKNNTYLADTSHTNAADPAHKILTPPTERRHEHRETSVL